MKKYLYISLAVLLAVCCSKNTENGVSDTVRTKLVPMKVEAGFGTKTVMAVRDGKSYIDFVAGDEIGIWDGSEVMPFTAESSGNSTAFDGNVNVNEDDTPIVDTYYAVSPYVSGATAFSNNAFSVKIPHIQTAVAGGFDPAAQISCASAPANKVAFDFNNAVAFAKITLDPSLTSSIGIMGVSSTDGDAIAGELRLNPTVSPVSADSWTYVDGESWNSVQFNSGVTGSASGKTTYYLALRPGAYNLQFYAQTTDGSKYCTTIVHENNGPVSFLPNQIRYIKNLKETDLKAVTPEGELQEPGELGAGKYLLVNDSGTGTIIIQKLPAGSKYNYSVTQIGEAGTRSFSTYHVVLWETGETGKVYVVLCKDNGHNEPGTPYAYMAMEGDELHSEAKTSGLDVDYLASRDGWVHPSTGITWTTSFSVYSID